MIDWDRINSTLDRLMGNGGSKNTGGIAERTLQVRELGRIAGELRDQLMRSEKELDDRTAELRLLRKSLGGRTRGFQEHHLEVERTRILLPFSVIY